MYSLPPHTWCIVMHVGNTASVAMVIAACWWLLTSRHHYCIYNGGMCYIYLPCMYVCMCVHCWGHYSENEIVTYYLHLRTVTCYSYILKQRVTYSTHYSQSRNNITCYIFSFKQVHPSEIQCKLLYHCTLASKIFPIRYHSLSISISFLGTKCNQSHFWIKYGCHDLHIHFRLLHHAMHLLVTTSNNI